MIANSIVSRSGDTIDATRNNTDHYYLNGSPTGSEQARSRHKFRLANEQQMVLRDRAGKWNALLSLSKDGTGGGGGFNSDGNGGSSGSSSNAYDSSRGREVDSNGSSQSRWKESKTTLLTFGKKQEEEEEQQAERINESQENNMYGSKVIVGRGGAAREANLQQPNTTSGRNTMTRTRMILAGGPLRLAAAAAPPTKPQPHLCHITTIPSSLISMSILVVLSLVATSLASSEAINRLDRGELAPLSPDELAMAIDFTPTRKPHLNQLVHPTPVAAAAAAATTALFSRSGNLASGSSNSVTSISSSSTSNANNSPISSGVGNKDAGQIISIPAAKKNNSPITSNSQSASSSSSSSHSNRRADNSNNHHHHHNHHHHNHQASGSSNKLTRANELDLFLDDMNHNELRAIASGKPIDDMFQVRPAVEHQKLSQPGSPEQQAKQARGDHGGGLDSSQSEQQIYSECALILQRTYVKNIDDPKHQLVPFGKTEQSCIGYKDIDKAIALAKKKLKFLELTKLKKKSLKINNPLELLHTSLEPPEDLVAAIGELNMATTQIIANKFDLSNDEVLNGLPLINMAKTKFWPLCPALVRQDIKCELSRYRTQTGHCNNLKHPTWGAAMTPFARYLPPVHPDGVWVPRKSVVTEITFHLSDGHHETHSNVSPALSVPVYGERASSTSVSGATNGGGGGGGATSGGEELHVERGGAAHSWRHLVRYDSRENLDMDQSAQLALHVQPDSERRPHFSSRTSSLHHHDHHQTRHSPQRPFEATAVPASQLATGGMASPAASATSADNQLAVAATTFRNGRSMATELPSARLVTSIVHRDVDIPSHDFSILFMSWGQLLDHDMTRAAQPPSSIKCCTQDEKPKHKLCLPIQVPPNDPFYSKFNVQCLEFRRSLAGLRPNCVLGPRVHQNAITAPIDANFVYGSSRAQAEALRLFKGGRLRDRDWFKRDGLKPLLPAQEIEPDQDCIARPKDLFCFLAGDVRVNEQTHLTVLHTLYMREHNRLAERLEEINPHWDDERLYQETRHIMAAGVQHVMINEYLPLLIGKRMADLYNLTAHNPATHPHHSREAGHSYWHGYDPSVTTSVSNSFAAAAFRQGHTFVQGQVERYNKFHEFVTSEQLRRLFKQPFLLYQPGVLDELTSGMINQPSQSYDPFISEDISGHLFQPPESKFGHDLPAINLQRGREQGLPGYNLFREWCGLPRAETFDQLEPYLTNHTAYHYSRLYKHVDDIDLWSGGVSERKLPGAAIGPTFACIIARQFSNTRRGDRFWYENPGLPSSFTPDQLVELRKITLAKILCTNSDDLPTIQRWALRMAHPVLNPRLPCHQLPEINLGPWQE